MFEEIKNKIKIRWQPVSEKGGRQVLPFARKKKIIAITAAVLFAFLLWVVVNLNRSFTINIQVPVALGNISTDRALAEELPQSVSASISGEGWSLLKLYRNPPQIFIEVSQQQVNLFEQVRRQVHATANVTVQKVDPFYLQLHLQEKVSKTVPIAPHIDVNFTSQYGFLESPRLQPDSVTVTGARSVIADINQWVTDSLQLNNINSSFERQLSLKAGGPLVTLSEDEAVFKAQVVQFTEGGTRVSVELRGDPFGNNVSFSPASVFITFLVPLEEFAALKDQKLFAAYVTYPQIMEDTTGFVTPQVEQLEQDAHLKIQQIRPPQVAYFNVIDN